MGSWAELQERLLTMPDSAVWLRVLLKSPRRFKPGYAVLPWGSHMKASTRKVSMVKRERERLLAVHLKKLVWR